MTPSTIIQTTAEQHGVTAESILSRDKSATLARADAMTAMRKEGMKFREIAEHFERHISTVHQVIGRTPKHRRVLKPTIRGVTYDSVADAADAIGVSQNTIYEARRRGTLDHVGLGAATIATISVTAGPSRSPSASTHGRLWRSPA